MHGTSRHSCRSRAPDLARLSGLEHRELSIDFEVACRGIESALPCLTSLLSGIFLFLLFVEA
jgi:hypothetical protein